jgi:hypothetical protein
MEKHKEVPKKKAEKKLTVDKLRENPWILSTIVLAILAIILIVGIGSPTGKTVSGNDAGQNFVDFINSKGEAQIEFISANNFGSNLYEVTILAEEREVPVHLTKDGKYLVQIALDMGEKETDTPTSTTTTPPASTEYSEGDLVKLGEFSTCLAEKGIKIYGANWCGWTKKLVVETLGGFDVAGDAYVECTEEQALCSEEGVSGYPTIKFNGEAYQGARTLEGLGTITGCSVPTLDGSSGAEAPSSDVQCS